MGKLGSTSITTHSWNADGTQLLIGSKDGTLEIYNVVGTNVTEWTLAHQFKVHSQCISSVDWHAYGYFLSTSHDRSVLVWKFINGKWQQEYVNLRQSRAVLDGKWNEEGDKFVVGTGSRTAAIGYYNISNETVAVSSLQMWNAHVITALHDSSIISVSFEKSGLVFASAGTDNACKIVSSYLSEIDSSKSFTGAFSDIRTCGEILYNFGPPDIADWVNAVAWSPDSSYLAFTTHNSVVHFWKRDGGKRESIAWNERPFLALAFASPTTLYAGGFDFSPVQFQLNGSSWSCGGSIEKPEEAKAPQVKNNLAKRMSVFETAQKFEQIDRSYTLKTRHKNIINSMRVLNGKLTSTDISGTVVVWD